MNPSEEDEEQLNSATLKDKTTSSLHVPVQTLHDATIVQKVGEPSTPQQPDCDKQS